MDRTRFHISAALVVAVAIMQTAVLLTAMSQLNTRLVGLIDNVASLQAALVAMDSRVAKLEETR